MATKKPLTPLQILKEARNVIAKPGRWIKGTLAKNKKGEPVAFGCSNGAHCFCALGAIQHTSKDKSLWGMYTPVSIAARALEAALPGNWTEVGTYNDAPRRTPEQIVRLFDRAIANIEKAS